MNAIERHIDKLGRIVLPMNYRQRLNLCGNAKVSISVKGNSIVITPTESTCALCGCSNNLSKDVQLCFDCIKKVKTL